MEIPLRGPATLEEEEIKMRNAECRLRNKMIGFRGWGLGVSRIPSTESRTPKLFWISLFILILSTGCATTQDMQMTQRDLLDQRNKIASMQNEIAEVKGTLLGVQKSQADLDIKTDLMRTEIQNLQGKIDEIKFHAEKASNDTLAIREELVAKLKEQDEKINALRKDVDTLKPQTLLPPAIISQPQPGTTPSPSAEEDNVEDFYHSAYGKLKSGDLEGAREAFKKFLEAYPSHNLASNAQFWIGETYYREKKYEEAVIEFDKVIKKYPKGNKVPDAMLKEGLALSELGKGKEAKYVLKKLIEKYPRSEPAKIAKSKLEQM
jgi:tol-pal system protein YbgF